MGFLDDARPTLRALFDALGRREDWTDDDSALIGYMERRWLGIEHGPGVGKDAFDEAARERAWPLLRELGLVDRVDPPASSYDEVVVMGAAGIGLHRRLELVRTSGVATDLLTVLAGRRPHSGLARDGALDELLAPDGRFGSAPGWTVPAGLDRSATLLAALDPLLAAQAVLPSETDLARLVLGKQWPGLRPTGIRPTSDGGIANELGTRQVAWEEYDSSLGRVRLLDGAAVDRGPGRPARPTSRSTLQEWIAAGFDDVREVLIVVNQPHLTRVRHDIRAELEAAGIGGHDGPRIDIAGCAVLPTVDLVLVLGEIPARINADRT